MEWGVHVLRPVTDAEVALLLRGGIGRVTFFAPWRWTERLPGQFDPSSLDHFLAPLRAGGMPLQAVLGPGMPHLVPDRVDFEAAEYPARFADWCGEAASRLTDVTVFRVEDELNAAWTRDQLRTRRRRGSRWRDHGFRVEVLARAFAALRAARPDAELRVTVRVGLPRWRAALQRWRDAGVAPDRVGVSVHPCAVLPDPDLAQAIGDAVEQARVATGLPVEVARTGYGTSGRRRSPRRQREYVAAAAAAADAAGATGLHWFALRDQAHDDPILRYWTPAQERHMGLLYYDSTPKPALDEVRVRATGDRFGGGA